MTTIRNNPFPQHPPRPQPQEGPKLDAQRAFFAAIAGKSQATGVAAPQNIAPAQVAEQAVRTATAQVEPPQKILRPGSLLDIRV